MKKIIKRLLTGVLALATICTSLPASPVMAKERASTTGSVVLEKHPQLTYQFDNSFPEPFNKKLLGRALMFGYNDSAGSQYAGTWLENVIATQSMVWVITGGQYGTSWEKKIVDTLLRDSARAKEIYYEIRANIENYDKIPTFTASSESKAKDYELKYNMNNGKYELSLTDNNNVLKYFDFASSGISINRSGNKLNLSSSEAFDTRTLKANKNLPKDELPAVVGGSVSASDKM